MAASTSSLLPEQGCRIFSSLESLVSHLLAAKRSLSCVEYVYRANDIVSSVRQALESHTITKARIIFIRNSSNCQVEILDQVHSQIKAVARDAASEFQATINDLDAVEGKLSRTLDQLRETTVEACLQSEGESRRNLVDFVDETGVDGLLGSIKESIDATGDARGIYEKSIEALEDDISRARGLLSISAGKKASELWIEELQSPVPDILQTLEERAQEMADNLESLVKHFDLCVTAIKYTEGGGAAARKVSSELPEGVDLGLSSSDVPLEPIGEDEKRDMLDVLEKDASEVEDVVMEIRDRNLEMEADLQRAIAHTDQLSDLHGQIIDAFGLLEVIGARLPSYITQSQLFVMKWDEEKAKIQDRMEELESLQGFYEGFLRAYDNLLIEIGRRKTIEVKMAEVAQDAIAKIDRLYAEDVAERDAFRQEQGDFLPVDIWPGLMAPPIRYQVSQADLDIEKVPDLSASTLQKAIRRVSGK